MSNRPDFTNMTVEEMQAMYQDVSGSSAEQARSITNRKKLAASILSYIEVDDHEFFESIEQETRTLGVEPEYASQSTKPNQLSPQWTEYVLSLLSPEEYDEKDGKKYPRASGLRRITQLLIGPIIESGPIQVIKPELAQATIVYSVRVRAGVNEITVSDIADAHPGNTPGEFAKHPSATASTRAEGRALRKLLCINTATAEEMSAVLKDDINDIKMISNNQRMLISNVLTKRANVDLDKFLALHGYTSLDFLTSDQAKELINTLNGYQQNSETVPEEIK